MSSGLLHALDVAESSMSVQSQKMGVIAENIANVDTPDYQRRSVVLSERLGGGVEVAAVEKTGQGVNLEEEMTDLLGSQRVYQASAAVIKSVDEMLKTTIDMMDRHQRRDEDYA